MLPQSAAAPLPLPKWGRAAGGATPGTHLWRQRWPGPTMAKGAAVWALRGLAPRKATRQGQLRPKWSRGRGQGKAWPPHSLAHGGHPMLTRGLEEAAWGRSGFLVKGSIFPW